MQPEGGKKEWIRAKQVNNLRKKNFGREWPVPHKMQDLSSLTRTELRLRALTSGLPGNSPKVNNLTQFKLVIMAVVFQLLSHVRLCDPMDYACQVAPSFTILGSLLKFTSIESVMLSISSSASPFSFCLQSFPTSGSFPVSWLFASGGQSIGTSATVLPTNIQGCFPIGLTGLISLLSKGLHLY